MCEVIYRVFCWTPLGSLSNTVKAQAQPPPLLSYTLELNLIQSYFQKEITYVTATDQNSFKVTKLQNQILSIPLSGLLKHSTIPFYVWLKFVMGVLIYSTG